LLLLYKDEVIIINKTLGNILLATLIVAFLIPNIAFASNNDDSTLNTTVDLESYLVNAKVNIDARKAEVYINGEGLNDLRPQYHIKKTSYNDTWIKNEIQYLNDYIVALETGLSNIYAKESNEVNELFRALVMLRSELYQEMYRLHFGQTMVKTIIGTDAYTVNSDIFKFNTLTSYRVSDFITLMSIRLLESLGVQFYYDKVDDVRVVTMVYGDKNVVLRENSDIMVVFDSKEAKKIKLQSPMIIIGTRTYIPTRDVSEHLGFEVLWNEVTDTIIISLPQAQKPQIEIDEAIYADEKEEEPEEQKEEPKDIKDSEKKTEEGKTSEGDSETTDQSGN
jgi:NACalpha-BTF3-like transcription factor